MCTFVVAYNTCAFSPIVIATYLGKNFVPRERNTCAIVKINSQANFGFSFCVRLCVCVYVFKCYECVLSLLCEVL